MAVGWRRWIVAQAKKTRSATPVVHDRIAELEAAIAEVRSQRKSSPRTSRLIASGLQKMAKKLGEEAIEVAIEAVRGERSAVVRESVDLLYNLVVLWSELGITTSEIWEEMDRRQALLGIAEKLPKDVAAAPQD
jgi:phosphoribosyl-ATP pyrophosphohydrolase